MSINKNISALFLSLLSSLLLFSCNARNDLSQFKDISVVAQGNSDFDIESTSYLENDSEDELQKYSTSTAKFIENAYRRVFNEYDTNRNGTVETKELPEAPESFAKMDKNKDGRLTFSEVVPSTQRLAHLTKITENFYKELFRMADSDEDNKLSTRELTTSKELSSFRSIDLWKKSLKSLSQNNGIAKKISSSQFNILMNHLFLTISIKYTNLQPVRSNNDRLPVILVQGYGEPSWYFLFGIYNDLKKNGWNALYPVNLFPNITDIREQAKIVARKIEQAKKEQGVAKVEYVAHSMGGLIGRYYIQNLGGANSISHYISIATPHYGTYAAYLGIGEAARQMKPGSEFLAKLNSGNPLVPNIKYTSMWTKTDELVIPAENALLRGSEIMPDVKFTGHLLILWVEESYKQIKKALNS